MSRLAQAWRRPGGYRAVEAVTVAAVLALLAAGTVGLAAAIVGQARPAVVWPIAGVAWLGLLAAWRPDRCARPDLATTVPLAAVLVGVLVIGASTATNAAHNGQYVRADRDNGIYTAAAFWIAHDGDVLVDGRQGPLRDLPGVRADSIGQAPHRGDDRTLEIHGAHLVPALLAQGDWVAGTPGVQLAPAAIGAVALAAFFLLALWFLRPWTAVAVVAALAFDFVFVYGVRSVLTEPTSLAATAAGLWAIVAAGRSDRSRAARWAVAGAVSALALAVRVDGGVTIAGLPVAVAVLALLRGGRLRRAAVDTAAYVAGALPVVVLAFVDLEARSPGYARKLADRVGLVRLALLAGLVGAVAVLVVGRQVRRGRLAPAVRRWEQHRDRVAAVAGAATLVLFALLWFVRPLLGRVQKGLSSSGWLAMENLQRREGFEPNGRLSFDELSLDRIAWYIGPLALVLGIVGVAILIRRLFAKGDGEAGLLLALVLPATLLYVWKPSIFPDQPWMMRRYLPVVLPGLLFFAGLTIDAVGTAVEGRLGGAARRWAPAGIAAVAAGVLVGPPLQVTVPLWSARWQAGGYHGIEQVCDRVGDDATVLFAPGGATALTVMTPVRSICEVPVLRFDTGSEPPATVAEGDAAVRSTGRRLWVIGPDEDAVRELVPGATEVRPQVVYDTTRVQPTLYLPPNALTPHRMEIWIAEVTP